MLAAPADTPYDLSFRLLSIPVRIHPLFWLTAVLLGWSNLDGGNFQPLVIWVVCVLLSILVHEFGHGLMARSMGFRPIIMLYMIGGLCDAEADRQTPRQKLFVLLAGPGAGFALLIVTLACCSAFFGMTIVEDLSLCRWALNLDPGEAFLGARLKLPESPRAELIGFLIQINLLWSLINLLPVFPLDGGQIAGIFLQKADRSKGRRRMHALSIGTAGACAAYFLFRLNIPSAILFACLAFYNFQAIQALQRQGRFGVVGEEDDADWWKR